MDTKNAYEFPDSPLFSETLKKKEFNIDTKYRRDISYLEPYQLLIRNYISRYTPYENVLLYYDLGTGKTCAAISIAEGFRELLLAKDTQRKIVVLVKNKNIQKNFINELMSDCTGEEYSLPTKELAKKINSLYTFITYGTFVNKVLGIREYEKDDLGISTNEELSRRKVTDSIKDLSNCIIIVDEAHNITNNEIYTSLEQVLDNSYNTRLVLLSATPIYDNPREIFELANLLSKGKGGKDSKLPIRGELIRQNYLERYTSPYLHENILKGGVVYPTKLGLERLSEVLRGKISYVPINNVSFPKRRDIGRELIPNRKGTLKVVYCQMSRWQYNGYVKALLEEVDTSLYKSASDASTIVYPGVGGTESHLYGKEGFLSVFKKSGGNWVPKEEYRDLLVGDNLKKVSVKLARLIEYIQRSDGPIFIYSNFVNYGGISLINLVLTANGYTKGTGTAKSFMMYDDSLDPESRDKLRKSFNSERNRKGEFIKILVGSPIASEGITLKAVRQVHILEPTWNMSKLEQIIGRCIRNYSHDILPPEDRRVDVFKYASVYSPKNAEEEVPIKFFIDREKYIICEEKNRANKVVERRLKEIAIDCSKSISKLEGKESGTAECDYSSCQLVCEYPQTPKNEIDYSTFKEHINFFAKHEIDYLEEALPLLFRERLLWHFNDIVKKINMYESSISPLSIEYVLYQFLNDKRKLVDGFGRDGFLVHHNQWFIFNSYDNPIESSHYAKAFDFQKRNETALGLTLENWATTKFGKKIKVEEKKKKKLEPIEDELTEEQREKNKQIKENSMIYGTYYSRFGIRDDTFRIVDKRFLTEEELADKRKELTGMACNSYSKNELVELLEYLSKDKSKEVTDKKDMCRTIRSILEESNSILE